MYLIGNAVNGDRIRCLVINGVVLELFLVIEDIDDTLVIGLIQCSVLCESLFNNFLCVVFELCIREIERIYLTVKLEIVVNVYGRVSILKALVDSLSCLLYRHAAYIDVIDECAGIEGIGTRAELGINVLCLKL